MVKILGEDAPIGLDAYLASHGVRKEQLRFGGYSLDVVPQNKAPWNEIVRDIHKFYRHKQHNGFYAKYAASTEGAPDAPRDYHQAVNVLCGLVSSILDFDRMSFSEVEDILSSSMTSDSELFFFHRDSLVSISRDFDDRVSLRDNLPSIYVAMPHIFLVNNEFILKYVDRRIDALLNDDELFVIKSSRERLKSLLLRPFSWVAGKLKQDVEGVKEEGKNRRKDAKRAQSNIDYLRSEFQKLRHLLLKEYHLFMFQYPKEKELFRIGTLEKQLDNQLQWTMEKIKELHEMIEDLDARRKEKQEFWASMALAFLSGISMSSLLKIFFDDYYDDKFDVVGRFQIWLPVFCALFTLFICSFYFVSHPVSDKNGREKGGDAKRKSK